MHKAILLLAILLCNCRVYHPQSLYSLHKNVYVSKQFTQEQKESIVKGMRVWECATNGTVHFNILFDISPYALTPNDITIAPIPSNDKRIQKSDNDHKDIPHYLTAGLHVSDPGQPDAIFIVLTRLPPNEISSILEHEIGHSLLGKKHDDDPHSIMYPIINATQVITKHNVQEFTDIYDIDIGDYRLCR